MASTGTLIPVTTARDDRTPDRRPEWLRRKHGHAWPKPRTKLDLWADKVVQIPQRLPDRPAHNTVARSGQRRRGSQSPEPCRAQPRRPFPGYHAYNGQQDNWSTPDRSTSAAPRTCRGSAQAAGPERRPDHGRRVGRRCPDPCRARPCRRHRGRHVKPREPCLDRRCRKPTPIQLVTRLTVYSPHQQKTAAGK